MEDIEHLLLAKINNSSQLLAILDAVVPTEPETEATVPAQFKIPFPPMDDKPNLRITSVATGAQGAQAPSGAVVASSSLSISPASVMDVLRQTPTSDLNVGSLLQELVFAPQQPPACMSAAPPAAVSVPMVTSTALAACDVVVPTLSQPDGAWGPGDVR